MIQSEAGYTSHHQKDEALARSIIAAFSDLNRLRDYFICCRKYARAAVRRAFMKAMAASPSSTGKSRGSLFFYLVKYYAHRPP